MRHSFHRRSREISVCLSLLLWNSRFTNTPVVIFGGLSTLYLALVSSDGSGPNRKWIGRQSVTVASPHTWQHVVCIVSQDNGRFQISVKIEFYHHPLCTFHWFSNFVYCIWRLRWVWIKPRTDRTTFAHSSAEANCVRHVDSFRFRRTIFADNRVLPSPQFNFLLV